MNRTYVKVVRDELGDSVSGPYGYVDGYLMADAGYAVAIVVDISNGFIKQFPLNRLIVVSKHIAERCGA